MCSAAICVLSLFHHFITLQCSKMKFIKEKTEGKKNSSLLNLPLQWYTIESNGCKQVTEITLTQKSKTKYEQKKKLNSKFNYHPFWLSTNGLNGEKTTVYLVLNQIFTFWISLFISIFYMCAYIPPDWKPFLYLHIFSYHPSLNRFIFFIFK